MKKKVTLDINTETLLLLIISSSNFSTTPFSFNMKKKKDAREDIIIINDVSYERFSFLSLSSFSLVILISLSSKWVFPETSWSLKLAATYMYNPFVSSLQYRVAQKKRNIILPTICGCNNWYQCMKFRASTLSHKLCGLENKLLNQTLWSWYHFSQEKLPHTLIPVMASTYCWKYAILFVFMGHPVLPAGWLRHLRWNESPGSILFVKESGGNVAGTDSSSSPRKKMFFHFTLSIPSAF